MPAPHTSVDQWRGKFLGLKAALKCIDNFYWMQPVPAASNRSFVYLKQNSMFKLLVYKLSQNKISKCYL